MARSQKPFLQKFGNYQDYLQDIISDININFDNIKKNYKFYRDLRRGNLPLSGIYLNCIDTIIDFFKIPSDLCFETWEDNYENLICYEIDKFEIDLNWKSIYEGFSNYLKNKNSLSTDFIKLEYIIESFKIIFYDFINNVISRDIYKKDYKLLLEDCYGFIETNFGNSEFFITSRENKSWQDLKMLKYIYNGFPEGSDIDYIISEFENKYNELKLKKELKHLKEYNKTMRLNES